MADAALNDSGTELYAAVVGWRYPASVVDLVLMEMVLLQIFTKEVDLLQVLHQLEIILILILWFTKWVINLVLVTLFLSAILKIVV